VVSTAANVNEGPMLWVVLTSLPLVRPQPERTHPHHLCLDAALVMRYGSCKRRGSRRETFLG
jgi:hypothetical protein